MVGIAVLYNFIFNIFVSYEFDIQYLVTTTLSINLREVKNTPFNHENKNAPGNWKIKMPHV